MIAPDSPPVQELAVVDARPRGWFWIDNAFLDEHAARLGPIAVTLYCTLVRMAGQAGQCYPSIPALCRRTGVAENSVRKHLRRLADAGLIAVSSRKTEEGDDTSHLYTITGLGQPPRNPLQHLHQGVQQVNHPPGAAFEPPLVQHLNPKKTQYEEDTEHRAGARVRAAELSEPERGTPDPYQQASELLHECQDVLYRFTGAEVTGRQAEEFRTQVAAHLKHGREVDRSLLEEATTRAESAFRENGQGRRGVGWVLNALRDLLQEDAQPRASLLPRVDAERRSWRRADMARAVSREKEADFQAVAAEWLTYLRSVGLSEAEAAADLAAMEREVREEVRDVKEYANGRSGDLGRDAGRGRGPDGPHANARDH